MLQGQVEKLNRQNTEQSHGNTEAASQTSESRSEARTQSQAAELIPDGPHASSAVQSADEEPREAEEEEGEEDIFEDSESEDETQGTKVVDDAKKKDDDHEKESETSHSVPPEVCPTSSPPLERYFLSLILTGRVGNKQPDGL